MNERRGTGLGNVREEKGFKKQWQLEKPEDNFPNRFFDSILSKNSRTENLHTNKNVKKKR